MVTVVDAANVLPELEGRDALVERGLDQHENDERAVSDLLMDQIEFARHPATSRRTERQDC